MQWCLAILFLCLYIRTRLNKQLDSGFFGSMQRRVQDKFVKKPCFAGVLP